jgi:hypothetical protein
MTPLRGIAMAARISHRPASLALCCLLIGSTAGGAGRAMRVRAPFALRRPPCAMQAAAPEGKGRGFYVRCEAAGCRRKAGEGGFCADHAAGAAVVAPAVAAPERTWEVAAAPAVAAMQADAPEEVELTPPQPAARRAASPRLRKPRAEVEPDDDDLPGAVLDAAPGDPSAGALDDAAAEEEVKSTDMEIIFLGTGSCLPTGSYC